MLNIILIGLAISVANALQVITWFGSVVIALPFVSMILGIKNAIIVLTIISYLLSIYILATNYVYINHKKFWMMLLSMFPFFLLGMYVFRTIDSWIFKQIIAVFIIFVSLYNIFIQQKKNIPQSGKIMTKNISLIPYLALIGGGFFQGAISSWWPLAVIYLADSIKDKKTFRTTLSLLWFVLNTFLIVSYFYYGIEKNIIYTSISQLPFLILGIIVWEKVYKQIKGATFSLFVYILLVIIWIIMIIV